MICLFWHRWRPVLWDKYGTGRRDQPNGRKCVRCGLYEPQRD